MVPRKIKSYFKTKRQKLEDDNTLIEGMLICCDSHEFEVRVSGKIKNIPFSGMYLYSENDRIVMEVCCKKCGKVISVFDSNYDGYENCEEKCKEHPVLRTLICKKCHNNNFLIHIKYEYPDIEELNDLELIETDNAFTWIWISLECNVCGIQYRNFVDFETA